MSDEITPAMTAEREPIADHWIVWDALLLLFTPAPFRGPDVYCWSKSMTPEEIREYNARPSRAVPDPAHTPKG